MFCIFVMDLPNVYLLVSHNAGLSVVFLLQKVGCPKQPENIHKLECNLCSFSLNGSQYHIFSQSWNINVYMLSGMLNGPVLLTFLKFVEHLGIY
jgi:hypothetical protein